MRTSRTDLVTSSEDRKATNYPCGEKRAMTRVCGSGKKYKNATELPDRSMECDFQDFINY